jgi:hypothetical protein
LPRWPCRRLALAYSTDAERFARAIHNWQSGEHGRDRGNLLEKETLTREEFLALVNGGATAYDFRRNMVSAHPSATGLSAIVETGAPRSTPRLRPEPA